MRQLVFQFLKEHEYLIPFPTEVERELKRQMARAIMKVSQTEGGRIDEHLTNQQQGNGNAPQS